MLTSSLLVAGLIPVTFNFSEVMTFLYYLVLIPPAIFQCYKVLKDHFIPTILSWFKSKDSP